MAEAQAENGKVGTPADLANELIQTALEAARRPPIEPTPDPRVSAAFALGWQMAELYRPGSRNQMPPAAADDLPGLSRLDADARAQVALSQVEAGLAKLADAVRAAGVGVPSSAELRASLTPPVDEGKRRQAVWNLHVQTLSSLTAADFRLGKAYGLGRALADTCRTDTDIAAIQSEFKPHRITKLRTWLDDLASAFPPHAGKSVEDSLRRWAVTLAPANGETASPGDESLRALRRQGELWRALLSGEKSAADMLEINNYLDAATGLLITMRGVARRFIVRLPLLAAAIVILFAGGIALIITTKTTSAFVAGAAGILASLGLSWKSVGGALGGVTANLERQLWGAELDTAIADAVTLLPPQAQTKLTRRDKTQERHRVATELTTGTGATASSHAAVGPARGSGAQELATGGQRS